MKEPNIWQIGRAIVIEFETPREAEIMYKTFKKTVKVARIINEDENTT